MRVPAPQAARVAGVVFPEWSSWLVLATGQRVVHDPLRLADNSVQVGLALETFCVNLVDVLRAGGARREPTAAGHHLQAPDGGVAARGVGQPGDDRLAGE